MVKYKRVFCDILECTEFKKEGVSSSTKTDRNEIMKEFNGRFYFDGKIIKRSVPFIELGAPFHEVYVPEDHFNAYTKFLINFFRNYLHKITLDEKRFFSTMPVEVGDIFVHKI